MRLLRCVVLSLSLGLLPVSAGAQRISSTVDLTRLSVRDDSASAVAMLVAPILRFEGENGTIGMAGTFAHFEAGGWTSNGIVHASVLAPIGSALVGELAGVAGGSLQDGAAGTAQMTAQGRLHLPGARYGAWVGGGGGGGWDGAVWRRVLMREGGVWWRGGPVTVVGSFAPTRVADSTEFLDSQLALRVSLPRVELGAAIATRSGERFLATKPETRPWGSLNAALWFSSWGALVASGGSYPVDVLQGYPDGRFASVGLRLGTRPDQTATRQHWRAMSTPGSRAAAARRQGLTSFAAEPQPNGLYLFRAYAPEAREVQIMGDFTGWKPVSLRRGTDGWWSTTVVVPAGTHHMNVRVDRGQWLVPPGFSAATDEFEVETGVLVVR